MGVNIKFCNHKYCVDERNVYATWRSIREKNEDVVRVYMQVKELFDMRDICIYQVLNRGNVVKLLNVYVQSNVFSTENIKFIILYF